MSNKKIKQKLTILILSIITIAYVDLAGAEDGQSVQEFKIDNVNQVLSSSGQEIHIDMGSIQGRDWYKNKNICEAGYTPTHITKDGRKLKMLGWAIVFLSPGIATGNYGHIAERFVFCENQNLRDYLFELFAFEPGDEKLLFKDYPELQKYSTKDFHAKMKGKSFFKLSTNPVQPRVYGQKVAINNRDIVEFWLPANEKQIYKAINNDLNELTKQSEALLAGEFQKLPDYSLTKYNCASLARKNIEETNVIDLPAFKSIPKSYHNSLKKNKNVEMIVFYPSQRSMRLLSLYEEGRSAWLEKLTFTTKASKGAKTKGWVFMYANSESLLSQLIVNPTATLTNSVAGIGQSLWGLISLPVELVSRIPRLSLFNSSEDKEPKPLKSLKHVASGSKNVYFSFMELFNVHVHRPLPTPFTEGEKLFFAEYNQKTDTPLEAYFEMRLNDQVPQVEIKTLEEDGIDLNQPVPR